MKLAKRKTNLQRFAHALLLALLLNFSGHIFLHLGDVPLHDEEALRAASHDQPSSAPAQHQCSFCQDQQLLTLDVPATEAVAVAGQSRLVTTTATSVYDFQLLALSPSRAPPRH